MDFYTSVRRHGNNILYRGINEYGKQHLAKFEFQPTLFVPTIKASNYHTLFGDNLMPIQCESIRDARDYIKQYEGIENHKIYGENRFEYEYISKEFPDFIQYDISKMVIYALDIETKLETNNGFPHPEHCYEEISLITIYDSLKQKSITFGQYGFTGDLPKNAEYFECINEQQLLKRFLSYWKNNYPDIVTDWNGRLFDIPYLYRRIHKMLGESYAKKLSPFGIVQERIEEINDEQFYLYDIYGIEHLDYLDLYKKFTFVTQESYKLDNIAFVELGENKIENPYNTFREFYEKDWNTFVLYNIKDADLVFRLETKLKLIEQVVTMAYMAKCNFADILSPVKTWELLIYNRLLEKNIVSPIFGDNKDAGSYPGAYVRTPLEGFQKWVMTFDVNSEYPHVDIQFNISPETIVENERINVTVDGILNREYDLSKYPYAVTANGVMYRTDKQGIIPELMEYLYSERKKINGQIKSTKDTKLAETLDIRQKAFKLLLNSGYGALANKHFKYFDIRLAESITLTGQVAIRTIGEHLNKYINKISGTENVDYWTYSDTDSVFMRFDKFVEKYFSGMDEYKIAENLAKIADDKILPQIGKAFEDLARYTNCPKNRLKMGREIIASNSFFCAKKKYAMLVLDKEGKVKSPPDMKIMGLEIVRSSTPKFVRNALRESVRLILSTDLPTVRTYVEKFQQIFYSTNIDEISFPRGVNNIAKYYDKATLYKKGCPIHVRASLLHNFYVTKKNVQEKYQMIEEGAKVKFVYLRMPNPIKENVIAYQGKLPHEFNLDKYVDYGTMYEKVYLEPLQSMLDAVNWRLKEVVTMDSFWE